jgi:nucleolar protein 4
VNGKRKEREAAKDETGTSPAKSADKADGKPEKRGLEKLGAQLGGMIGRKRKMRKGGK